MATKTSNKTNPFGTFGVAKRIRHFLGLPKGLKQGLEALAVRKAEDSYKGLPAGLQQSPAQLKIEGYAKYPFLHRRNHR